MADNDEVETTDADEATETESTDTEQQDDAVEDPTEGLKKALRAERLARREAERKARDLETERENASKEPAEQALDQARREAAAEATSAANKRILRTEIRAIAKGRLADPADALLYLDADTYIGDDGDVDTDAIEDAISELLSKRPYLGVDAGEKFRGGADQGAKGKQAKPSQLSKADIEKLSPAELMKAYQEGRVDSLIGRTN